MARRSHNSPGVYHRKLHDALVLENAFSGSVFFHPFEADLEDLPFRIADGRIEPAHAIASFRLDAVDGDAGGAGAGSGFSLPGSMFVLA